MTDKIKNSKFGLFEENAYDGSRCLSCPVCDQTYHHIKRVATQLDPEVGDETTIYAGTSIVVESKTGERRSALRIDIGGECGHRWSLILQQHKGQILVEVEYKALLQQRG